MKFLRKLGIFPTRRAYADGSHNPIPRQCVRQSLADLGNGIVGLITLGRFMTDWSVKASQKNLDEAYGAAR